MQEFVDSLDKIVTLSNSVLTYGACLVFGYVLRFIKRFPNDGIPIAVVFNGAVVFVLLADPRVAGTSMHTWATRYMVAGSLIGFIAWMSHKFAISRFEDWLSQRFEVVGRVLGLKSNQTTPGETKTDEKTTPPSN